MFEPICLLSIATHAVGKILNALFTFCVDAMGMNLFSIVRGEFDVALEKRKGENKAS